MRLRLNFRDLYDTSLHLKKTVFGHLLRQYLDYHCNFRKQMHQISLQV